MCFVLLEGIWCCFWLEYVFMLKYLNLFIKTILFKFCQNIKKKKKSLLEKINAFYSFHNGILCLCVKSHLSISVVEEVIFAYQVLGFIFGAFCLIYLVKKFASSSVEEQLTVSFYHWYIWVSFNYIIKLVFIIVLLKNW